MNWYLRLTAADHEQNGFVALADWHGFTEAGARQAVAAVNAMVPEGAEPSAKTDAFNFILDLMFGDELIGESELLPTQVAMKLAPEQVRAWLNARPDPDAASMTRTPPALAWTEPSVAENTDQEARSS